MAVSYNSLLADVMAQLNALAATSPVAAESSYNAAAAGTLAGSDKTSTDWPLAMIQNAILDNEIEIIRVIAENEFHPERRDFFDTSNALSAYSTLPTSSATGNQFISKFSMVREGASTPATERPAQIVSWIIDNENEMFTPVRPLHYAIIGGQAIRHTSVSTVVLLGPVAPRLTFTGDMRLRDYHRPFLVSGSLAQLLAKEGAWPEAQATHQQTWNAHVARLTAFGRPVAQEFPSRV